MGEAFFWGLVGGSSLVIGGVVARRLPITERQMGLIMAFGAGVLISAVAYELVLEAFETSAGANLPESIAASAALERAGRDPARIIRFWVLVALGFGLASLAGYVVLDSASPRTVAIVLAFAGGAVLTMLANTMMPEALHHGGKLVGLLTTLGFALAFGISALQ